MTQEEKQLLFKDLCPRLPYGVMCRLSVKDVDIFITEKLDTCGLEHFIFGTMDVRPYLRPMSSMDEMEREFFKLLSSHRTVPDGFGGDVEMYSLKCIDWLNAHHFDYHTDPFTGKTLIESGLALEAPEDMYTQK